MNRIGFCSENMVKGPEEAVPAEAPRSIEPRRSVVQVSFPGGGRSLAYYNDSFDLHPGDMVYVEGKMEGVRGRVTEVNCNFRIRLADYKRVVAVVDTEVHGEFFSAGTHFITFDPAALPAGKARGWFLPPADEEEFASGSDDTSFPLEDLREMKIAPQIVARGGEYYAEDRVKYLSLDGTKGYAIVEGSHPYEVEFELRNGEVSGLTCTCFCSYTCKHEFAAMLQLKELLDTILRQYEDRYDESGYFAAVLRSTLVSMAVEDRQTGGLIL